MLVWLFFLLQASHAVTAAVTSLDYLHIPKTGGSFGFMVTVYNCDTYIVENEYNASTVGSLFWSWNKGTPLLKGCKEAPHTIHRPVSRDPDFGHDGHRIEDVATMLRRPKSRIASGFMYQFKFCDKEVAIAMKQVKSEDTLFLQKYTGKWAPSHRMAYKLGDIACSWLGSSEAEVRSAGEDAVMAYSDCQAGCSARMITGVRCPRRAGHSADGADAAAQRLRRAKQALERFAFVGLTEKWSQSMCVFTKLFPRASGQPYPVAMNDNSKPPPPGRKKCEALIESVLAKRGVTDPDEDIYTHGQELLETQLKKYPECRNA